MMLSKDTDVTDATWGIRHSLWQWKHEDDPSTPPARVRGAFHPQGLGQMSSNSLPPFP